MSFMTFLAPLVQPITKLIDEMHTSEEEKLELKAHMFGLQSQLAAKLLDYETNKIQAQADVIKAEATGASWIQRNWRPVLMLSIVAIIVNNYLLLPYASALGLPLVILELPDSLFTLMQIGVGGYIVGRSGEKIADKVNWGQK